MGPKKAVTSKGKKGVAKTTKPKKEKDPNAPKRPSNAFQMYMSAHKDFIKKRYPSDKIQARASEMWKALEDKSEWEEKAKDEKAAYEEAMKDYESGKQGSKSKDDNKTKKPAGVRKGKKKVESDEDDVAPPEQVVFSDDD